MNNTIKKPGENTTNEKTTNKDSLNHENSTMKQFAHSFRMFFRPKASEIENDTKSDADERSPFADYPFLH